MKIGIINTFTSNIQSVFNGGSNELDNLTPQTPEDNLEYNKRNIVK